MTKASGAEVEGFAVMYKEAVVASSLEPDQLVRISREKNKATQIFFPQKKFLVTAPAANFRFFFILESLPESPVLELHLDELIRASENAHSRMDSHFSEIITPDKHQFLYTNAANCALRISQDSKGRKFQAENTFNLVNEELEEEVYLQCDGNWYCGKEVSDRRVFVLVDGDKMIKPNSLNECQAAVTDFCKTTLGSVFMP